MSNPFENPRLVHDAYAYLSKLVFYPPERRQSELVRLLVATYEDGIIRGHKVGFQTAREWETERRKRAAQARKRRARKKLSRK
jgi:hypothetical protein